MSLTGFPVLAEQLTTPTFDDFHFFSSSQENLKDGNAQLQTNMDYLGTLFESLGPRAFICFDEFFEKMDQNHCVAFISALIRDLESSDKGSKALIVIISYTIILYNGEYCSIL